MRDLVLTMGCSIDLMVSGGPEEDIGGGGREHPDFVERKLGWLSDAGVLGMGRGLYEEMSDFWQSAEGDYARWMNQKPKVVFSRTLDSVEGANTTLARDDLRAELTSLQESVRGDVAVGGAELAAEAARLDLIDEYRLFVHPVAVGGGGVPFFPRDHRVDMELVETRTFSSRVVYLRFRAAGRCVCGGLSRSVHQGAV